MFYSWHKPASGLACVVITLTSGHLHAAEQTPPVIVTATRTTELADATLSPVIVIDQETIAQNPGATVADLLQQYSSIEMGRNGGSAQTTSIFIRGAESNHTLVMVDGVRINPGTIGGASLQNIDLSLIDHIEIVKGPRSTTYGSDAIGGVINIITKRGKPGTHYQVSAGGGSYDTAMFNGGMYNTTQDKSAGLQISAAQSNGFPTRTTSSIDRGYSNLNINLYGSRKFADSTVTVSHWHANGTTQYLGFSLEPLDQDFLNTVSAINVKTPVLANWQSNVKLSHINDEIRQNRSADYANTQRLVLDWQNDIQAGQHNLISAGVLIANEQTAANVFGTRFDEDIHYNAGYVQNIFDAQSHKLVIGGRVTDHESYGHNDTWNIEYGFAPSTQWRIILANNSGFRAPDSTDRFGFGGNRNLLAETSVNNEVGLRYHPNTTHQIELNYFDNKIKNLIEYNSGTSTNENISRARIDGTELIYRLQLQPWQFRFSATVQNPYDESNNRQLARRAKHLYNLHTGYHSETYDAGVDIIYHSNRPDSLFNTTILQDYTLVNLSGQYRVTKVMSLTGRLENLMDEVYQLAGGYRSPGRSFFINANFVWDQP